jgi:hypothetical protein
MQEGPVSATMTSATSITGTTVGEVLAPLHERWLAALQVAVGPALAPASTRWDRWTAVRYLRDELAERLAQERKLVRSIPGLSRTVVLRVEAGFEALERVIAEVNAAGRRRHTSGLVMVLLRNLLEHMADWYVAIEHAIADVPLVRLSPEAIRLLGELQPDDGAGPEW